MFGKLGIGPCRGGVVQSPMKVLVPEEVQMDRVTKVTAGSNHCVFLVI